MVRLDAPLRPEVKVSKAEAQAASAPYAELTKLWSRDPRAEPKDTPCPDHRPHQQRQHRRPSDDLLAALRTTASQRRRCLRLRMAGRCRKETDRGCRAGLLKLLEQAKIAPPGPGQVLSVAEVDAALAAARMGVSDRMMVKNALSDLGLLA